MSPLRILILSDGRPGHYHLSEGIAAAMGRLRPIDVTTLQVRRRGWPGRVLAALTNHGASPGWLLRTVYRISLPSVPPADVVVSAGAETLAASICLARLTGVPNIFYGSLRQFRPEDFSLVLTSYQRNAGRPRHAWALKPSQLDPETLSAVAVPVTGPDNAPAVGGLLIGGDSGQFKYSDGDWKRLLGFLEINHQVNGTRWIASNSRRTAPAATAALEKWARSKDGPILEFIDVAAAGAGTLTGLFDRAQMILCTDDSSSMVSESIWARRPVLGVTPERHAFTPDEKSYREALIAKGWCRSLPIDELTPDRFLTELAEITPLAENPLDDLADLLRDRLPTCFGPAVAVPS